MLKAIIKHDKNWKSNFEKILQKLFDEGKLFNEDENIEISDSKINEITQNVLNYIKKKGV